MKPLFAGCLLLILSASVVTAQPFTRRCSQVQNDGLKQYYEVANFKLGEKYDLPVAPTPDGPNPTAGLNK